MRSRAWISNYGDVVPDQIRPRGIGGTIIRTTLRLSIGGATASMDRAENEPGAAILGAQSANFR
jgi:hypothetical protein